MSKITSQAASGVPATQVSVTLPPGSSLYPKTEYKDRWQKHIAKPCPPGKKDHTITGYVIYSPSFGGYFRPRGRNRKNHSGSQWTADPTAAKVYRNLAGTKPVVGFLRNQFGTKMGNNKLDVQVRPVKFFVNLTEETLY